MEDFMKKHENSAGRKNDRKNSSIRQNALRRKTGGRMF